MAQIEKMTDLLIGIAKIEGEIEVWDALRKFARGKIEKCIEHGKELSEQMELAKKEE